MTMTIYDYLSNALNDRTVTVYECEQCGRRVDRGRFVGYQRKLPGESGDSGVLAARRR